MVNFCMIETLIFAERGAKPPYDGQYRRAGFFVKCGFGSLVLLSSEIFLALSVFFWRPRLSSHGTIHFHM